MRKFSELKSELMELSLPIGIVIVTAYPDYNIIFANQRFCDMLGFTDPQRPLQAAHKSAWDCIYGEDIARLRAEAALRNGDPAPYEVSFRAVKQDGSLIWVRQCSQHMRDDQGNELVYAYYTDISAQKQTEQALRESESRYAAAVKAANINIWEYDYATDVVTTFSKSAGASPAGGGATYCTKTAIAAGHLREDSIPVLSDLLARLRAGAAELTADLWVRSTCGDAFWCERILCTNAFDDAGRPARAYCVGRDITREKEAEKRYHQELSYRQAMQKATMASINLNLTQDTILDYKSAFPEITAQMEAAATAHDYFEQLYTTLATAEMQRQCAATFSREALLQLFANGQTTLSQELTRTIGGQQYWTIMTAHMMQQDCGDIVAFLYATDVTSERTMRQIMNAVVQTDYDFLVVVDALRNSAVRYSEKSLENVYAYQSERFEPETQDYVRRYICPEDAPRVALELSLPRILLHLEKQLTYSVVYTMPGPSGSTLKKQLRFSYINRDIKSILMTRVDITAAVEEQEQKNQALVSAVQMAQRANAAKSEFLSRVSHELRTPMNAIMGMDQLAAQHLHDPVFLGECIEKSQYASRYLLQLLNDILDMSKIETGKVLLKREGISCQSLLSAINTILASQAAEKGVTYTTAQVGTRKGGYLGDGVRLQQILVNLLTNAVKFTPPGGAVHLSIAQISGDAQTALLRFTVSDTGIGISPAFLPHLFEPFVQEHNEACSSYGGSGLGLAISKNLAQLMGGDIFVESTLGQGTTFRVEIPFGLPADGGAAQGPSPLPHPEDTWDLSGRTILLVEDHPLNIMVATKLLEFKGAHVVVAENGKSGLALFSAAPSTYDAILMDIRMPVMDGLACARAIRSLGSPWARAVPIIAMSANAFQEDVVKSEQAGMNAHLAKPIEGALLYQTLQDFLSPRSEKAGEHNG